MILFAICGIALIISLGLPGMSRGGRGGGTFSSGTVAKVASQEVSFRELQYDLMRRDEQFQKSYGSKATDPAQKGMIEQFRKMMINPERALDEIVQRKVFFHLFEEQNMQVSKGAIRSQIEQLPYFQKNGAFDADLYRKLVTVPFEFENNLRNDLKSERVIQPFALVGSLLSNGEVEVARALSKKKVFETLQVSPKIIKTAVTVSSTEVSALVADSKKDPDLQNFYNKNIKNYKKPEEVSANHILIKIENSQESAAETKIKDIQKEIKNGKISFEDAAKKYSQDLSNAPRGGALGYFAHGVMDPEFEKAAFALSKPNDVSNIVKSSFGYHLIKLIDKKSAVNTAYADVKNSLAKDYLENQKKAALLKEIVSKWMKSKNGPDAAQLKAYGLAWTKASPWDVGQGRLGSLGENDVKSNELLALKKQSPLLPRAIEQGNDLVLVRFVSESDEPVKLEDVAFQKSIRVLELYFTKYKKNLEEEKKIVKSEKVIAEVKKSLQL